MKNPEKRWFEVEGFYTALFGFTVQASDKEEAERLFWESEKDVDEMQHHVDMVEVTSVSEPEEKSLVEADTQID